MFNKQFVDDEKRKRLVLSVKAEKSLAEFTKQAWDIIEPSTPLIWNWHLDTICGYLEALHERRIKRLIINIPPGAMKSLLVSVMYPCWVWQKDPGHRFLGISNEQGLSIRDALKAKWIMSDEWFENYWPIEFQADQNQKTLYANTDKGFRQSLGITGNITGKRGDTIFLDDPHDATGAQSELQRQTVLTAYDQKISSRVNSQEDSAIVLIMQRLHEMDLTGHLLNKKKTNWVHLSIPMEYEGSSSFDAGKDIGRPDLNDIRTKDGELLFPGLFSADAVKRQKEDMGEYGAAGQLQQRPSPAGGGILKKHWWRIWPDDMAIPVCEHLFLSWDTAYSEKDLKSNSFSAMVAFGVFWHEQDQRYCLIMIDAWDGQVDYPKLRKLAIKLTKDRKPDIHLIEKKASGQSLVQDLRQAKIGVRTYNPDRDKVARAYAVSALLASGVIYAPNRRWADRVIDMLAIFPNGASPSSDYTDCVTQALLYLKNGAWVENPEDIDGEDIDTKRHKERVAAYG